MNNYFEYIDLAKGVGICLVILGHGLFPYHYAIDAFHMPLFFIIAGLTFKTPIDNGIYLLKKIDRLFIPYLFFSIVSSIMQCVLKKFNGNDLYLGSFNGPLWFFPVILGSLVLYSYLSKLSEIKYGIIMLYIYVCVTSFVSLKILPFDLDLIFFSTVFVYLGNSFQKVITCKYSVLFYFSAIIVYVGGLFCAHKMSIDNGVYMQHTYSQNILLYTCLATSGSYLVIKSCHLFSLKDKNLFIRRFFQWLGKNSLVIMAVHFPMCQILNIKIASMDLYHNVFGKIMLGVSEFFIVLLFSVVLTIICKSFLPRLTGYKHLLFKI